MAAKRLGMLRSLACLFVACVATYSCLWIWQTRSGVPGIGIPEMTYQPKTASLFVNSQIVSGSVADVAGLKEGDRILAIEGTPLRNLVPVYNALVLKRFAKVDLLVERAGVSRQFHVSLSPRAKLNQKQPATPQWALLVYRLYPLCLLAIASTVLVLKPTSPDAWRLSFFFAGAIALPPLYEMFLPNQMRGFAVGFQLAAYVCGPGFFYAFFAVFPSRAPLDRSLPWLKAVLLGVPLFIVSVPAALCILRGGAEPLYQGVKWPGAAALVGLQGTKDPVIIAPGSAWFFAGVLCSFGFGLVNLIWSAFANPDREGRRKARVIF